MERRRSVLATCVAALAGTVPLSGCSSSTKSSTERTSPGEDLQADPKPTGADRTTSRNRQEDAGTGTGRNQETSNGTLPDVSASFGALQPAIVELVDDTVEVEASAGQYLFVDISVDGGHPPKLDEFGFQMDGREYPAVDEYGWNRYDYDGLGYRSEAGAGWILFELPDGGDATNAKLTWDGGEWVPGRTVRTRLGTPFPELKLSASLPDSVPEGEAPIISATVTNDGESPTEFVAALERVGGFPQRAVLDVVYRRVSPGRSETWEYRDDYLAEATADGSGDGDPDPTYRLHWEGRDRESALRVTEK